MKDSNYEEGQRDGDERDREACTDEETRGRISRLVLDVLKPRQVSVIELGEVLASMDGVSKISITSREVDSETETLRIALDGPHVDYRQIVGLIENHGATVRSIDEVVLER
jgi:hypothetical protein